MKPVTFVQFCERICKLRLTPAQRILIAVSFDGVEPSAFEGTDRDIARRLFGNVDTIPPEARAVIVWVIGARSGKSRLASYYSLWRGLVADLSSMAPGELASALIVGPDARLGRQTLRYAQGIVRSTPELARLVASEGSNEVVLQRPDGHRVTLEVLPATHGGRATRGRAFVSAVLEECAFFRDSDTHLVNDSDLFASVSPRVLPGGQVILASTPWTTAGLLYDEFSKNHGMPSTALAAHAPTDLMRDGDVRIMSMIERERDRDSDNARREYDAVFFEGGGSGLFDPDSLDDALRIHAEQDDDDFTAMSAGGDLAYIRDASACVIVGVDEKGNLRVGHVDELRPSKGAPLIPSVVVGTFARACQQHGIGGLVLDGHGKASAEEHLAEHGIEFIDAPSTQRQIADAYVATRDVLNTGRLGLPNHKRLLKQLREATLVISPGGGASVRHPRTAGSHGDLAAALVNAVWNAQRGLGLSDRAALTGGGRRFTESLSWRDPHEPPWTMHDLPPDDD